MGRSRAIQTMQRRRGVALITAILIATIAAAAAVAISVEQNIAIMRTANIVAAGRAEELLASVEFLALDALTLDAKHSQFDDLSEAWSKTPLQAGNASGDSSGSIEDLQGRFNLTNLAPSYHGAHPVMADPRNDELGGADSTNTTTTRQRPAEVRFRLLLNTLDIDAGIVQAILDWADTDSETRFPNGAEDDYYLGLSQPYRTGNRPLTSVRELLLILDEDDRPYAPGQVGRVVVTSLHNFAMPIIRYAIGDYAEVGAACDCGRGLPVIARVTGRRRNLGVLPGGRCFVPEVRRASWKPIGGIERLQLVQTHIGHIEIRIAPAAPLTDAERQTLQTAIGAELGHPFEFSITEFDEVGRHENGKFEPFVSELPWPDDGLHRVFT